MRKRTKLLIGVGIFLLLAGIGLAIIWYTSAGLNFAIAAANRFAPVDIETENVRGSLNSDISADRFKITIGETTIVVYDLYADIETWAAIQRDFIVNKTSASRVEVLLPPPAPENKEPFSLPDPLPANLKLNVKQLDVDSLVITQNEVDQSLSDIKAQLSIANQRLEVTNLSASNADARVSLSGNLDTANRYAHELEVAADLAELGPVRLHSKGDVDQLTLDLNAPDQQAQALLTLVDPVNRLDAGLDATYQDWQATAQLSGEHLDFSGQINAKNDALELNTQFDRLVYQKSTLALENLTGQSPTYDLSFDADGELVVEEDPKLDFAVQWQSPQIEGSGQLSGTVATPQFKGRADVTAKGRTVSLLADLGLDPNQQLGGTLESSDQSVFADVQADLADPDFPWSAQLQLNEFNPELIDSEWSGEISGAITARGNSADRVEVRADDIAGSLRGYDFAAAIETQILDGTVANLDAQVSSGSANIQADFAENLWSVDVDIPQLQAMLPEASGNLVANIQFSQKTDEVWEIQGKANSDGLQWQELAVGAVTASADMRYPQTGSANIDATNFVYGEIDLPVLNASLTPQGDQHVLQLKVDNGAQLIKAQAQWDELLPQDAFKLAQFTLQDSVLGLWELREPATLTTDSKQWRLEPLCLEQGKAYFCFGGEYVPDQVVDVDLEASKFPLDLLEPVPIPISMGGEVDITAKLNARSGAMTTIEVDTNAEEIRIASRVDDAQPITLSQLTARVVNTDNGIDAKLTASALEAPLDISIRLDNLDLDNWQQAGLGGQLRLAPLSAAIIDEYIEPLQNVDGEVSIDVGLSGTLGSPLWNGEVRGRGLAATAIDAGTVFNEGQLDIEANNAIATVAAQISAGEGSLRVNGQVGLQNIPPETISLRVTGEKAKILDRPAQRLIVTPDLVFTGDEDSAHLEGSVRVDEGRIRLEGSSDAVNRSPDVVVIGRDEAEQKSEWPVTANVRLIVPEPMQITGYGLDGELTGDLRIRYTDNGNTLAQGELRIKGMYEVYGQELEIRDGRLLYTNSPIENPALALEAVREVDDITVGVNVTGLAEQPRIEVFSNPNMPETEALSYLLLGRSLNSAGSDIDFTSAALGLGLSRGADSISSFGKKVGLDELSVAMRSDLGGAALSLGRRLSPRLFLRYTVGLIEPVDLLQLEYKINRRWFLRSEIGEETRAAIEYQIETGRYVSEQQKQAGDSK